MFNLTAEQHSAARGLCQEAVLQRTPLELEQWTSMLLGHGWRRREPPLCGDADSMDPVAGEPLLSLLMHVGGQEAKTVLTAIARIERGVSGRRAAALADALDCEAAPRWMAQVGTAAVVRAFSATSPGEGEGLLLEAEPVGNVGHMVAVFIDDRLGGIAKRLALLRPIDPYGDRNGDGLRFSEVPVVDACQRVADAIDRTDRRLDAPVDEGFVNYRALALARVVPAGIS